MQVFNVLDELESYLVQVDLAIEGKADWPTPIKLENLSISPVDRQTKIRLTALLKRNEEAIAKVERRKKDLTLLEKRISKRESSGPIAVDIRA